MKLLRPRGLVAGLRLQTWSKSPSYPALAFANTSGGRTLILPTARKHGYKAGMKPKDTDEILEAVSCSAWEGMGKKRDK